MSSPRENTDPPTSLTHRWWWQGAVVAVAGVAVIAFQWEVISTGAANPANWVMVALGGAAVVYGLVEVLRARRQVTGTEDGPGPDAQEPAP